MSETSKPALRHDWSKQEMSALFELPFNDLLFQAQTIHRQNFDPNQVQVSTLLSIKTGACPEDCGYCSQSSRNDAEVERERLLPLAEVIEKSAAGERQRCQPFLYGRCLAQPDR